MSTEDNSPFGEFVRLLRLVFGAASGFFAIVRIDHTTARNAPGAIHHAWLQYPDEVDRVAEVMSRQDHRSCYFTPVLYQRPGDRSKPNRVEAVHVFQADLDAATPALLLVPPSVLIETSPGRFQALWTASAPVPPAVAEHVNERIYRYHKVDGADSCHDAGHLMRVPGTINRKPAYDKPPGPPIVRVVYVKEGLRYAPEDFDKYPQVEALRFLDRSEFAELPEAEPLPTDEYSQRTYDNILREVANKGRNSDRVWHLMCRFAEKRWTPGQIRTALYNYEPAQYKNHEQSGWLEADLKRFLEKRYPEILARPQAAEQSEEERFWTCREELEHIRTFARSRRVDPLAALLATEAYAVFHIGPSLALPPLRRGDGSLNFFAAIVGVSGHGKGGAEDVARDAFRWPIDVEPLGLGSGEGVPAAYVHRAKNTDTGRLELVQHETRALFSEPEVDMLRGLGQRNGSTLIPTLKKGYSGESLGHQNRDVMKTLPVRQHSYRLCLILGVQPEKADVLFRDTGGGFPQRFVWARGLSGKLPHDVPETPEPMVFENPFRESTTLNADHNGVIRSTYGRVHVKVCQAVVDAVDDAWRRAAEGTGDPLDGHAIFCREKVALALAVLNGRIEINDEDWALAGFQMRKSDETRAWVLTQLGKKTVEEHKQRGRNAGIQAMASADTIDATKISRAVDGIRRKLAKTPGEWVTGNDLKKSLLSELRSYFDDATDALVTSGGIERQKVTYRGQEGFKYRMAAKE